MTEALMSSVVTEGARVDWERVIIDIQRSTWLADKSQRKSLREISSACGRGGVAGHNWAWNLKNIPGTEPKFHDAMMLLALWSEKTGKKGEELPLRRDFER